MAGLGRSSQPGRFGRLGRITRVARRPSAARRGAAGFSLVEVMVAFTLLGIGLLAVAGAQIRSIRGTSSGRHLSQSALIAQTQLEQLVRSSWADLAPVAWTAPVQVNSVIEDGGGGDTEQVYNVSWQIQDALAGETRAIDVRVTWTEADGRARTVATSTIRFNRENL